MTANKKTNILLTTFYFVCISLFAFILLKNDQPKQEPVKQEPIVELPPSTIDEFGLIIDSLNIFEDYVKRNETISAILAKYNVSNEKVNLISSVSRSIFDIRRIVSGKPYFAYLEGENDLKYFVYEQDPINYIVFDLKDSVKVYSGKKETTIKRKAVSGVINHSLYTALTKNDASPELVIKLSQVFAWQIDFYRIQKGNNFKVIYEEEFVGDEAVGIGKIIGARFNHNGEDFYAVSFNQNGDDEYFDNEGKSLRKAFLKAPLEYSRISSRYTKKRFHPVQKRYKPHLGTDYAAPTGTPIRTVGDGVVVEASYSRGNGNYVKVKHNSLYTTQYLHMSKRGAGIRPGVRVKQGQVIGYVGSTGLATGPHLCYRFWKNGVQVDPFKEKIPSSHPVDPNSLEAFSKKRDKVINELNNLTLPDAEDQIASSKI